MPVIIKPTWTENVALHASAALAAGASDTDDIDLDALGADLVAVQISITFGSTPDGNVVIEVFNSPDSGATDDNIAVTAVTVTYATSTTKIVSLLIADMPYCAIKVKNNDSADNVTHASKYAWRQWTTA